MSFPWNLPQLLVFATLAGALVLFVWGKWRYDLVGMRALLFLTVVGVIPAQQAFNGFSEPAVITVAAVLVISKVLEKAGMVALLVRLLGRVGQQVKLGAAVNAKHVGLLRDRPLAYGFSGSGSRLNSAVQGKWMRW